MEQTYWLGRKRSSAANARRAKSAEARLVHLDLAGRYSIKAAQAGGQPRLELEPHAGAEAWFRPDRAQPASAGPPRTARPGPRGDGI